MHVDFPFFFASRGKHIIRTQYETSTLGSWIHIQNIIIGLCLPLYGIVVEKNNNIQIGDSRYIGNQITTKKLFDNFQMNQINMQNVVSEWIPKI